MTTINLNSIESSGFLYADFTQLKTLIDGIDDGAIAANTAKVTNATHTGEVTGDEALTIADNIIDEANLKLDTAPTNDYVLTADSTASGGMKWAEASGGFTDPMTTRGDIIYKNSAGTTTRLPAGTVGQVLTSDGTDIAWDDAASGGEWTESGGVLSPTTATDKVVLGEDLEIGSGRNFIVNNASDSGLQLGFGCNIYRISSDGHLQLSSQNGVIEINGDLDVTGHNSANGHDITINSTAPSSPSTGDVWIDIS